ncbi:TonB-dependent receptor [Zavarzinia compransoris]|uniref:TonB-dependent receptor n=1 Tax=Zavarzinia marina TaxID=2911065 RepID=UPI001F15CD52|nr:TonB-dependent receptor [Zavarzinia marina]MCF4165268.1 TonB-dependent receptor [Zavarzinia marina]
MSVIFGRRRVRGGLSGAALSVALAGVSPAMAQEPADSDDSVMLDVIVVEGEKVPREVFKTYESVDVVTDDEIEDFGYDTLGQALNNAPNIRSFDTGTGNGNFVIRGQNAEGATQPSRSNPAISVVVDGAEQGIEATRRGTRGIWDVEQIEVLRGPQSTLQGRNALAGSIQIKTKDPTWDPEFRFEGIGGNQHTASGAIVASGPIVEDQLAVRIAGQMSRRDNGIEYTDPILATLGDDEFEEVRGKLLIEPAGLPEFSGLFTISHTHDKPAWSLATGPDFFARTFTDTGNSAGEFRDTKVNRYIADLSYEISPDWTINSISALVDTDVEITSPATSALVRDDMRGGQDLSQDIRLSYASPDSPVSGVIGVFAGRSTMDIDSNIQTTFFAPLIPLLPFQQLDATNESESFALYADARYEFADRWTLLAGGRLLRDEVSANYSGALLDVVTTIATFTPTYASLAEDSSVSDTAFLPKIGLAFDLAENQTIAATVSKGYRPGFSELEIGTANVNEVSAESLWAYELAYRSRWFGDRLQLNLDAFYYDYRDQQVPIFFSDSFPFQTITINAAESHAYGAEVEARWKPTPGLELFAGLGLLDTEFDEGFVLTGSGGAGFNLDGNEFPEAPAVTASLGGMWHHRSGFFLGGDVIYTDGFYSKGDIANSPALSVDAFTLVNANFGYEAEHFTVSAFTRNLFDEEYLTGISSGGAQAAVGEGRTFGIRLSSQF